MTGDGTTVAALIALAMGLVKVIELLGTWAFKKMGSKNGKNGHVSIVQLDPETARALREIHERTHDVHSTVQVRDRDGVPLVYSSRSNVENVQKIAECLRDVSDTQERISEKMDSAHEKIEDVLRIVVSKRE